MYSAGSREAGSRRSTCALLALNAISLFAPSEAFAHQANISAAERDRLAAWAENDPDGFWKEQAKSLDQALGKLDRTVTAALLIEVPDEAIVRRLSGRRTCRTWTHRRTFLNGPTGVKGVLPSTS